MGLEWDFGWHSGWDENWVGIENGLEYRIG